MISNKNITACLMLGLLASPALADNHATNNAAAGYESRSEASSENK